MALYNRLLGIEEPKLPIHQFQAIIGEWARGRITGAQANTAIEACSGAPLTPAEVTEALALVNTVPVGSTTAIQAARSLRLQEIDHVLLMVDSRIPIYDNETAIKARLGV